MGFFLPGICLIPHIIKNTKKNHKKISTEEIYKKIRINLTFIYAQINH